MCVTESGLPGNVSISGFPLIVSPQLIVQLLIVVPSSGLLDNCSVKGAPCRTDELPLSVSWGTTVADGVMETFCSWPRAEADRLCSPRVLNVALNWATPPEKVTVAGRLVEESLGKSYTVPE